MASDVDAEFTSFAEATFSRLLGTAYLLCGDWHTAEDLTQTALAKVFVSWHRISKKDAALAYARRTLVNTYLIDRRGKRWREVLTSELPEVSADAPGPEDTFDLADALARLPAGARAIVVLRYWEDMSVEQVAALVGCSTGNVKSQSARGLDKLRRLLDPAWPKPALRLQPAASRKRLGRTGMDESSLTALFERAVAARPPTPQLVDGSLRLGKKLQRRRRIYGAAATALAVGLIAAVGPAAFGGLSHPAPATRRHAALSETLYSVSSYGELVPISSGVAGETIQTAGMSGSFGTPAAVAPDHVIYAATTRGVIPIYTVTQTAGRPIRMTSHDYIPGAIVITPDGKTAYVMEVGVGLVPLSLVSKRPGKLIRIAATQLVMTPDGRTLDVLGESGGVVPIRTATDTALPPIPAGSSSRDSPDMEMSPTGKTVYVLSGSPTSNSGQLTPISTATNTAQHPITVPGSVMALAISPDGQTAYVTAYTRGRYVLLPIDLGSRTVLTPIRLPAQFWALGNVVFAPDGRMAYVAIGAPGTARGTAVVPIRTASHTALTPIRVGLSTPSAMAVSPDGSTVYVSGKLTLGYFKYALFPIRVGAGAAGKPISVPKAPIALVFAP